MLNKRQIVNIAVLICFLSPLSLNAQELGIYTQYMFNKMAINPAYAGTSGHLDLTALSRIQWQNIDGGPKTHLISGDIGAMDQRIGVGAMVMLDQIGVHQTFNASAVFAYHLALSKKAVLSLGMQLGVDDFRSDYSQVLNGSLDPTDPTFYTTSYKQTSPRIGFGAYFYTDNFYLGVSTPRLEELARMTNEQSLQINTHAYLNAGWVIPLSARMDFMPSVLMHYVKGTSLTFDSNFTFIYDNIIWMGVGYRSVGAVNVITQFQITPQFRIGYAYEQSVGDLSNLNVNTHEFVLNYSLKFLHAKVITPRYF